MLDVTFSISIMYVLVLMHYSRKRHMNFKYQQFRTDKFITFLCHKLTQEQ